MEQDRMETMEDTTWRGTLKQGSGSNLKEFTIQDALDNEIICIIKDKMLVKARSLVGKVVDITGAVYYRDDSYAPKRIEVQKIIEYKKQPLSIGLDQLYGMGRGFAKGKSSVELIREIRDRD